MIKQLRVPGLGMVWLCAMAAALHAERFPVGPDQLVRESDLVLVGQVLEVKIGTERTHIETGFGNYDWAFDLTLKIETIEKGQLDKPDTIVVRCFRIKSRKSLTEYLTPSGNHPIPDVGSQVRAHLYRRGGLWRVVYPNGMAPVSGQMPLADTPAIRALSSRPFTYWLPIESWFIIGVAVFLLRLILKLTHLIWRHQACSRN